MTIQSLCATAKTITLFPIPKAQPRTKKLIFIIINILNIKYNSKPFRRTTSGLQPAFFRISSLQFHEHCIRGLK